MKFKQIQTPNCRPQDKYYDFEQKVKDKFDTLVEEGFVLFRTDVDKEILWDAYLNTLPSYDGGRDHYNCNACRHFIQRYGGLAIIGADGIIRSALWDKDDFPYFFKPSAKKMKELVENANIMDVFKTDERTLGIPRTGEWTHLSVKVPVGHSSINRDRLNNAGQMMAKSKEEFSLLGRTLAKYDIATIDQAINILESNALYRGDRYLGTVKWFKEIKEIRAALSGKKAKNFLWLTIATTPESKLHIGASMLGTLLDDIQSGLYNFDTIKRRFEEKMDPSNYQRSQSAPTQGAVKEAERVVAQLGIADSLQRRYATLAEIPEQLWVPQAAKVEMRQKAQTAQGVFGNIVTKEKQNMIDRNEPIVTPTVTMTWEKFTRTILPEALSIEAKVESANNLMALVTAQNPESENILLWNNPFSWYYHGGVDATIKQRVEQAGGQYENNDIRCSLLWNNYSDLDLHCITPRGNHIYFGAKRHDGGWLDIDMNVSPDTEEPVENIRFSKGMAQPGVYEFKVKNYTDRNRACNPFKVELEVEGIVYTYEGIATNERFYETVFKFHYTPGQEPRMIVDGNSSGLTTSIDNWNIDRGYQKVNMIVKSPNLWGENPVESAGNHTFFLLEGCKDTAEGKGRGFFNEMLKPELRPIRKTLEAFTAQTFIEGLDEASACGLGFSKEKPWNLTLKVKTKTGTKAVKIDRWD